MLYTGIIGGERSEGEEDGDDEGHQEATGAEGKPRQKTENVQGGVREGNHIDNIHK